MTPDVVAVRQNLALNIQNGQAIPGAAADARNRWGSDHNQLQYTWRSGLGTDAYGDLIYVAGHSLTLMALTQAMLKAGIATGMELDIHSGVVTFNSFGRLSGSPTTVAHKLLTSMPRPANRYLAADQRDFLYVTAR